jgi:hypothetical protein
MTGTGQDEGVHDPDTHLNSMENTISRSTTWGFGNTEPTDRGDDETSRILEENRNRTLNGAKSGRSFEHQPKE